MRRDIRQEILHTAKALFNERGFNEVSTRDIADALGISKGNLTYYFAKKEDIVEAILDQNPTTPPFAPPRNLRDLNAFFLHMQQVVQENAFYFWHHAQLSQLSPKIRDRQHRIYRSNVDKFKEAFGALHADGIFRSESFENEYDRLIDALLLSCVYWMPFRDLTQKSRSQAGFERHAWALLHHLLTDKGRLCLGEII